MTRLSELLCAAWSDRGRQLRLCEAFCDKLLVAAETTRDAAPLVGFIRKCPHLGPKHEFLKRRLSAYADACLAAAAATAAAAEAAAAAVATAERMLGPLGPLLASQASTAEALISLLHALRCAAVRDVPTATLLYDLLGAEVDPERRALLLRGCRFATPPPQQPDEDVDAEAFEAAAAAVAVAAAVGGGERLQQAAAVVELAVETAAVETAAVTPDDASPPLLPPCALYRRFGARGEQLVFEYLRSATPKSLVKLFGGGSGGGGGGGGGGGSGSGSGSGSRSSGGEAGGDGARAESAFFAKLCVVPMRSWELASCQLEEAAAALTLQP